MKLSLARIGLSAIAALLAPNFAWALETVVSESACRVSDFSPPLRQTIVVLDQAVVETANGNEISDQNRRWITAIVTLAGVQEGQRGTVSAPRERITVLIALQDGADLVRVFTGCAPTFSADEIESLERGNSGWMGELKVFIGKDPRSRIEAEQKAFRASLLGSLVQLTRLPGARRPNERNALQTDRQLAGSFLEAMSPISRTFDIAYGIPRIVVISPMDFAPVKAFQEVKAAREAGFEFATKLGGDLQRAEVYLTAISKSSGKFMREFAHAFFLGSKGRLVATSLETLPSLTDAPYELQVFSGFIDYGAVKAPMQLRLAIDRSGSLVNSWVEIALERPLATPMTGKAVCRQSDPMNCEVKGDGKEFSQSWVADVGANPKFDQDLPFSGLRFFEFSTSKQRLSGRVYDPIAVIKDKKELTFELSRTPDIKF